jgi:hypothetical protein
VHFDLDPIRTDDLTEAWRRLGLSHLPLDLVECPERRITRAAAEVVAVALRDGETEVTVLLPRLAHNRFWNRFLHDHTPNAIAEAVGVLPHANVTIVPSHLGLAKIRQATEHRRDAIRTKSERQGAGQTKQKDMGPATARPDGAEAIEQPPAGH